MQAFKAKARAGSAKADLIPPMPVPSGAARAPRRPVDVVDAHFVVLARGSDGRTSAPNDNRSAGRRGVTHPAMLVLQAMLRLSMSAARGADRLLQWLPARGFSALTLACCLVVFGWAGGLSAVRAMIVAPTAPALAIIDVDTRLEDRNGMRVLAVYGTVENATSEARVTPPIAVDMSSSGSRSIRTIQTFDAPLAAGGRESFVLRLPYSGSKPPEVSLSFHGMDAPSE